MIRFLVLLAWTAMGWLPMPVHADAVALAWRAPAGCPDGEEVRSLLSQRLGAAETHGPTLAASGQIVRVANGFALTLRTPSGERRLEADSCSELAQSAAIILALLLDPRAAPTAPAARSAPASDVTANSPSSLEPGNTRGFVRAELVVDAGLLPHVNWGPGLAGGITTHRTSIELSAAYAPTQSIRRDGRQELGVLRAFAGRLGVCQDLVGTPSLGPCLLVEYTHLSGHGGSDLAHARDGGGALWSLFAAARLSIALADRYAWLVEVAVGWPLQKAVFSVTDDDGPGVVYRTGRVLGRARTGFELRF